MDNILYIGRLNGRNLEGGDGVQIKNNVFVNHLSRYAKVRIIDLDSLRKIQVIPQMLWTILWHIIIGGGYFVASGGGY